MSTPAHPGRANGRPERCLAASTRPERGVAAHDRPERGVAAHDRPERGVAAHDRSERGVAALVVMIGMLLAMVLAAVFAHRNLLFEQRSSANQYRAAQAFEAAEAGVEWALAQLNANRSIGPDCEGSTDPAATSFRTRYLSMTPNDGLLTPVTWHDAGTSTPLRASCVAVGGGWSCSCPVGGVPTPPAPSGPDAAPAFTVQFLPAARPGQVRIVSQGCTRLAGRCAPGSGTRADASARVEALLGLVTGLRTPPSASVTARGAFDAGASILGLHNADPGTGVAVNAGGPITAAQARLTPPAGSPTTGLLAGNDTALAALPVAHFFAAHFGVDKTTWREQPAVIRVECLIDCATVLAAAMVDAAGPSLIHVDGKLSLSGPMTLGSAERPVIVVVDGAAEFEGGIAVHGVLHAASLTWNGPTGGAVVHGAVLLEGSYSGNGTPELAYDPAVLARLVHGTGSFVRVQGSWRDF